jgi:hypothetical protein
MAASFGAQLPECIRLPVFLSAHTNRRLSVKKHEKLLVSAHRLFNIYYYTPYSNDCQVF